MQGKGESFFEALTLSVQIFIFKLLCSASNGFMKVLKTFIKFFEAPQRM